MQTTITITSKKDTDIINITEKIQEVLKKSKAESGLVNIFVKHTTSALTITEYEPGVIKDTRDVLEKLIPKNQHYSHNDLNNDDNGHAHIRSSLLKPDLTIPFKDNKLLLGVWQQIVLIDSDCISREREIVITVIESK